MLPLKKSVAVQQAIETQKAGGEDDEKSPPHVMLGMVGSSWLAKIERRNPHTQRRGRLAAPRAEIGISTTRVSLVASTRSRA
jgi:hypothetical protein